MNSRAASGAFVTLLTSLGLAACGAAQPSVSSETSSQAQDDTTATGEEPAPGLDTPVEAGESYSYPDGLDVSVGNWRISHSSGEPSDMARVDVTVSNPTEEPITTTQAWVSVRAGDTGEPLEEWAEGKPVDAVLQPGAEATGTYSFTAPETPGHVIASVSWLEANDPENRYVVIFAVDD